MEIRSPPKAQFLETCIRRRHSVRFYSQDPVDERTIRDCVALGHLAASNSNSQNWHLHLAFGSARNRIVSALRSEAETKGPNIPPLPDRFHRFRADFRQKLYGPDGYDITRDEQDKLRQATLRNFEFFGAPVCGVITMHEDLVEVDALSVGLFTQTLILALTERGLGSCLQVSVTGFPEILRREFRIPREQKILCGIAIGYPDMSQKVNQLDFGREDVDLHMTIHHE